MNAKEADNYFAGLIFADGWFRNTHKVNQNPSIEIELTDKGVVKEFVKWIGANSVRNYRNGSTFGAGSTAPEKFAFLDKHGVVSKVQVSPHLANSKNFWRGFIDGDGSLQIIKTKRGCAGALEVSNNSPVILDQLKMFAPCFSKCSVRKHSKNCYVLRTRSKAVENFVADIYSCDPAIRRKKNKANRFREL
jgi:hypothetical protein